MKINITMGGRGYRDDFMIRAFKSRESAIKYVEFLFKEQEDDQGEGANDLHFWVRELEYEELVIEKVI